MIFDNTNYTGITQNQLCCVTVKKPVVMGFVGAFKGKVTQVTRKINTLLYTRYICVKNKIRHIYSLARRENLKFCVTV